MSTPQLTWVNLQVGDYLIEELLSAGTFSWVYRGAHLDRPLTAAFKVASPPEFISVPGRHNVMPSQALKFHTGGVSAAPVDPYALLARQAQVLLSVKDAALVSIEDLVQQEGVCYLRLELISGKTLRQMLADGPVPLSVFIAIARALDRLGGAPGWQYHADLKPENIMVTGQNVKLLDPGYFGVLPGRDGEQECAVTTPAYYPTLQPDDLLAFGIMFWEAAMHQHPLYPAGRMLDPAPAYRPEDSDEVVPETKIGNDLLSWVRGYEHVGQYYLSPILDVLPPHWFKSDVCPLLEETLLMGLRLKSSADGLDKAAGFASFAQFLSALEELSASGIDTL